MHSCAKRTEKASAAVANATGNKANLQIISNLPLCEMTLILLLLVAACKWSPFSSFLLSALHWHWRWRLNSIFAQLNILTAKLSQKNQRMTQGSCNIFFFFLSLSIDANTCKHRHRRRHKHCCTWLASCKSKNKSSLHLKQWHQNSKEEKEEEKIAPIWQFFTVVHTNIHSLTVAVVNTLFKEKNKKKFEQWVQWTSAKALS